MTLKYATVLVGLERKVFDIDLGYVISFRISFEDPHMSFGVHKRLSAVCNSTRREFYKLLDSFKFSGPKSLILSGVISRI